MFGQMYNFIVRAINCVGVGTETSTVTVTLPGEGTANNNYMSNCQI